MKRLATLLVAAGLFTGSGLVLGAAPAHAAEISKVTFSGTTLTVIVDRDTLEEITVEVRNQAAGYRQAKTFAARLAPPAATFRASNVVVNGAYQVTVTSNFGSRAKATATFNVEVAPAAPTAVAASSSEVGVVTVSWNSNTEADRSGYQVLVDDESVATVTGSCGDRCTATLTGITPGPHNFAVTAKRDCPTCADGSISATSPAVTADVQGAEPTPEPTQGPIPTGPSVPGATPTGPAVDPTSTPTSTPGPDLSPGASGGPSAGPSPGVSGAPTAGGQDDVVVNSPRGGTTVFGGFTGFGSDLAVPGIASFAPPTGSPAPGIPDGTFEPQLAYDSEIREVRVPGSDDNSALGPIGDVIDSEQLMRTLAAALVLLLTGAHLRRWLTDAPGHRQ